MILIFIQAANVFYFLQSIPCHIGNGNNPSEQILQVFGQRYLKGLSVRHRCLELLHPIMNVELSLK